MKPYAFLTFALFICLGVINSASSAVYKWVDKNGNVTYSQVPPPKTAIVSPDVETLSKELTEEEINHWIVNIWSGIRGDRQVSLNLHANNKFEDQAWKLGERFSSRNHGKWSLNGRSILFEYTTAVRVFGKMTEKYYAYVVEIDEDKMVLKEPDGNQVTYKPKLKPKKTPFVTTKGKTDIDPRCQDAYPEFVTDGQKWIDMINNNCVEKARILLEKGLDPNAQEKRRTPLTYAVVMGRAEIFDLLIRHGANVNLPRDSDKATPIIVAAKVGNIKAIDLLYQAGADVEAKDWRKSTALIAAAKKNQAQAVKRLISYRANLDERDGRGNTALDYAQKSRYMDVIKVIIEYQQLVGKN